MDSTLLNISFEVPTWVKQGVDTGEYRIFGGVVRDSMGQIVWHLKEVGTQNLKKVNKNNLPIIIGVVTVLAVVGGSYCLYKKLKSRKEKRLNQQLNAIDENVKNYFSGNFATLTRADIENLIDSLKAVLNNPTFDHIKTDRQFYCKIIEFSKCVNQNTLNLALHKKMQIQLTEPNTNSNVIDVINIIINGLDKQEKLLFES